MAEANHNHISSSMDRRSVGRSSMGLSMDRDEDIDLVVMEVSDGFRPTINPPPGNNRMSLNTLSRERRSTPPPRPSSTTKPGNRDSFALRHDGAMESPRRPAAGASSTVSRSSTRSSSIFTETPYVRAESPYSGPAGPSHPYHMYTQNTRLARTASIATTSTIVAPIERHYTGPSGPTHPYGMYSQNIVPEAESLHDETSLSSDSLGFPGHGSAYQQRLGRNGEEASDIIGPLGHTEQLPPYTKYPENNFTRQPASGLPQISGAGGIGLATRDPEFASREDLTSPASGQLIRRSITSDSGYQINAAALGASEKPAEKRWKIIAKKKVWGIVPVWVFFLVGIIVLFFILILGAVLGVISHRRGASGPKGTSSGDTIPMSGTIYATVTTTYDVQSLSTLPTGIPPLPTGTFTVPIATPFINQKSCLDSELIYDAWSCDMALNSLQLEVSPSVDGAKNASGNRVSIGEYDVPSTYQYGSQPPFIASETVMSLVEDDQLLRLGPAWYFGVLYNKLVVAPEGTFSGPFNDKRAENKRGWRDGEDGEDGEDGDHSRNVVTKEGDRPWFCYWNGTKMEVFIYANQTSLAGSQEASASASEGQAAPSPTPYVSGATTPTQGMESIASFAIPTPAASGQSSGPVPLDGYPRVIEVEERRDPHGDAYIPPYCVQMVIQDDGSAVRALDDDGQYVIIHLNETEPAIVYPSAKRSSNVRVRAPQEGLEGRDSSSDHACMCAWLAA